ncbi:MAG: ComEC/Rec2 family competence protein, partial [Clostridiales bacterium]|nr:ComEC/Rec2 family competence protein [Clostridiales bacterium]
SHQSVFDAGFWLSCLATFGILITVPAVRLDFLKATKDDSRIIRTLKKAARFVIITFVTSAAAQMFTLPVIYLCFGGISLASLVSGIIIIPLSEICMILSMLSVIFMFVPIIKTGIIFMAKCTLSLLIYVVKLFSDIDGV